MSRSRYLTDFGGFSYICCVFIFLSVFGIHSALGEQRSAAPSGESQTVTVELSDAQCRRLIRHQPDADVAFQPGVDARGRPVAPADLDGSGQGYVSRLETPKRIVIPIEVDLFDRFGVPANPDLFEADAQVGQVIYEDGKLFYNGQRLADGASDQLLLHCREFLEAGEASPR